MAFNLGYFHQQAPHFIIQMSCKACQQAHLLDREAGITKIKEGYPYFDIFDEHQPVDNGNRREFYLHFRAECKQRFVKTSINVSLNESDPSDNVTEVQKSREKRKAEKDKLERSGRKGKRRRQDVPESTTQDWQSSFMKTGKRVWNRTMQDPG